MTDTPDRLTAWARGSVAERRDRDHAAALTEVVCPECVADSGRDSTPQAPGDYICPSCGDDWTELTPEQRARWERADRRMKQHLAASLLLSFAVVALAAVVLPDGRGWTAVLFGVVATAASVGTFIGYWRTVAARALAAVTERDGGAR